jgi:hypothetical protein
LFLREREGQRGSSEGGCRGGRGGRSKHPNGLDVIEPFISIVNWGKGGMRGKRERELTKTSACSLAEITLPLIKEKGRGGKKEEKTIQNTSLLKHHVWVSILLFSRVRAFPAPPRDPRAPACSSIPTATARPAAEPPVPSRVALPVV